jgi:hypothetical protein
MSRKVALVKNKMFEVVELCVNNPIKSVDLANMDDQLARFLTLAPSPDPGVAPDLVPERVSDGANLIPVEVSGG